MMPKSTFATSAANVLVAVLASTGWSSGALPASCRVEELTRSAPASQNATESTMKTRGLAARYRQIARAEWFRRAYEGRSLGDSIRVV